MVGEFNTLTTKPCASTQLRRFIPREQLFHAGAHSAADRDIGKFRTAWIEPLTAPSQTPVTE